MGKVNALMDVKGGNYRSGDQHFRLDASLYQIVLLKDNFRLVGRMYRLINLLYTS